jgi:hypothetical protein
MKLLGLLAVLVVLAGGLLLSGCRATEVKAAPGATAVPVTPGYGSLPPDG